MAEMQKTLITKEGLEKMQKELEDLRTTKRAEVAQRLKEAIAMGDLSENSEYDEAKNAQAFLEGRIVQLEQQIRTAQIIVKGKKNRIDVGSTVTIEDMVEHVKETGEFLIEIMPLMFIPAGVGLVTSWSQLQSFLVPLLVITVVSTFVVMIVTGKVTDFLISRKGEKKNG